MGKTLQGFVLDSLCTGTDDKGLKAFLVANDEADISIDAGALRKMDVGLIELLLAARIRWARSDRNFMVIGISAELAQRLDGLGLSVDALTCRAPA